MAEYTNFDKLGFLRGWSYRILPLVYDDSLSYYELLAKMTKLLNQLIENNNKLPEFLRELVREFLSGGEFAELLREILSTYILNVKYPPEGITPAVGDGSKEDTEAFQGCIDYAFNQGGGAVYVPYGDYLVGRITVKPGVALFGFDRNSTRLVAKGGIRNDMITILENSALHNLTIDANQDMQVNNVRAISCTGPSNTTLTNLLIKDAYDGIFYYQTSTGRNILTDILIDGVTRYGVQFDGTATFACDNISVSGLNFNTAFYITVSNSTFSGMQTTGTGYRGLSLSGSNNTFSGSISGCNFPHSIPGGNNKVDLAGVLESTQANTIEKRANYVSFNVLNNVRFETGSFEIYSPNGTVSLQSNYISLNPSQPLRYGKEPQRLNTRFNYIPLAKPDGTQYKVLVEGANINGEYNLANVREFGAKGDGVTDDTAAFRAAEASAADTIYVPPGTYAIMGVTSSKNWYCDPGSVLVPAADVYQPLLELVGSNKNYNTLFIDCKNYRTRVALRERGDNNHFETIFIKNIRYKEGIASGSCVIEGNNNTIEFIRTYNNINEYPAGNPASPASLTFQGTATQNYVGNIYANNCQGCVIDVTTGCENKLGNITNVDGKTSAISVLRGSTIIVDNVFTWGGEIGITVATEEDYNELGSVTCNNLVVGNTVNAIRVGRFNNFYLNNLNVLGNTSALVICTNSGITGGSFNIGRITGEGEIRYLFLCGSNRIIFDRFIVGEIDLLCYWRSVWGVGSFNISELDAKQYNLGRITLTYIDFDNAFQDGILYFNVPTTNVNRKSILGQFTFYLRRRSGEISNNAKMVILRPSTNFTSISNGYVDPQTGSIIFSDNNSPYNLVSYTAPNAGIWQTGTTIYNQSLTETSTAYCWVNCGSSISPSWKTIAFAI